MTSQLGPKCWKIVIAFPFEPGESILTEHPLPPPVTEGQHTGSSCSQHSLWLTASHGQVEMEIWEQLKFQGDDLSS